ncbi:probable G-protein coupled receptor Mth-like 1 [Helicoverpa zea]|uniref:probable G-protein coupled receptor Mth-like 1 n=1 Tax=Helicoverpa zea TaxID=7113 RepID=UPI001F564546|nr:probable G-protein coupled receptor Mth-like 1 [Helicoverpa zea]
MSRVIGYLAAWSALCVAAGGVKPTPVSVPRCCPAGQALSADTLRLAVLPAGAAPCAPAAPAAWTPRVYAPSRGTLLAPGFLPPHWRVVQGQLPACEPLRVLPEHAAPYALLANNGFMLLRRASAPLPPDRYCADATAALVCEADAPLEPSKCCAEGSAFNGTSCVEAEERGREALEELRALSNGSVGVGWPACAEGSRYAVAGALAGARLAGGVLELRAAGGGAARLAAGAWCAEALLGERGARVLACAAAARAAGGGSTRHTLYGAGLAVGAAFLAATLAAGFALPAAHHALHWRCQTHYVAALMLGDVLLAGTQLAGDRVPGDLCRALAVCMHFLFLSAFFWLNTMCFNIWWTFRDFRPTSLERGQELWRLRVYMVYAWGGPLLLAGAAAALDALPPVAAAPFLRPRFAVQRCWFYGDMEILVYFFGPVGVLLLVNLALFVSTTRQLTCGLWRRDEVKSTSERAALGRVCAKLVVVMGVTWGADVVSWAAGGPDYVWYATDLLNALQGVFIFLVVGCQPHAWAALKRAAAACCARGRPGARATHSSTHLPSCGESLTHTTPAPAAAAPAPHAAPPRVPMETVC